MAGLSPGWPPEAARAAASPARTLIISCEHGGYDVPPAYRALFVGQHDLLHSHRGWDAGALDLARDLCGAVPAGAPAAPLFAATTTRLLVDLNRSIGHPQLYSAVTCGLSRAARDVILAAHYWPHRQAVEGEVARRIAAGESVLHVAAHSFTPVLDGHVRRADIGWLYDPQRAEEAAFASRWMAQAAPLLPGLRLRRNNPYRGRSDGLTQTLRRRWATAAYLGFELEVNQRLLSGTGMGVGSVVTDGLDWHAALVASLRLANRP